MKKVLLGIVTIAVLGLASVGAVNATDGEIEVQGNYISIEEMSTGGVAVFYNNRATITMQNNNQVRFNSGHGTRRNQARGVLNGAVHLSPIVNPGVMSRTNWIPANSTSPRSVTQILH